MKHLLCARSGNWRSPPHVALAVVAAAVGATACSAAGPTVTPSVTPTGDTPVSSFAPSPQPLTPTVWDGILARIGPDGMVDTQTALAASRSYSARCRGVTVPQGPPAALDSGTQPILCSVVHNGTPSSSARS